MEHKPVIVINIRESEEQLVHICGYEGKIICKCSCEEHVPLVSLEIEMKNEIFLIQIYNCAILSGHLWSVKFLFFWYLNVSWIICASVKQNFFYKSEKNLQKEENLVNNIFLWYCFKSLSQSVLTLKFSLLLSEKRIGLMHHS